MPSISYDPFGSFDKDTQKGVFSKLEYEEKYHLVPLRFTDPKQNETRIDTDRIDYRLVLPKEVIDMNENRSQVIYDELGAVVATTVFGIEDGKTIGDGNIIDNGFQILQDINIDDIHANPEKYIQNATSFFFCNLFAWIKHGLPPHAITLHREVHLNHDEPGA